MRTSRRRVRAIYRKELREYRRSTSVVAGMAIIPLVFIIQPLISVFSVSAASAQQLGQRHELLYLLAIPALVPAALAAYAVVGERQQGTLEPVLSTPIRREELLLSKALAVFVPAIAIALAVYAVFLVLVEAFARAGVAEALIRGSDIAAQLIFTPLIAGWSIWIAIAISTRASDIRVAQQLSVLASLPTIAITTLIALDVIHASLQLAIALGAALVIANRLGWRMVSANFDRERLVTGSRS
jgi:ABC-2 type transport system permease protein